MLLWDSFWKENKYFRHFHCEQNYVTIAKQILMVNNVSMSECVEQLPLSTLEISTYLCWMKWFLYQICNTHCAAVGLKASAELWYCTLMLVSLNQGRILLLVWQNCCLWTTKKGMNMPHGKTSDPVQCHHHKVLFSTTQTLPPVRTSFLPDAHWETHCPVSVHDPVPVLSLPVPSEAMGCSQILTVLLTLLFLTRFLERRRHRTFEISIQKFTRRTVWLRCSSYVSSSSGYFVWVC